METGSLDAQQAIASSDQGRINVLLLISSLEHGGAERQVVELANHMDENRFDVTICSLSKHVPLAAGLRRRDQRLVIIPRHRRFEWKPILGVASLMRERKIHLVHCFLFDAEMIGRIAARLARLAAVVASERNTDYQRPRLHAWSLRLTRSWFDVMIANSESGKRFNIRTLGLSSSRIHVIRNGVDVAKFRPLNVSVLRRHMRIPSTAPVVGMVAAFKKQKRHEDFFILAGRVLQRFPACKFLCVGEPLRENLQGSEDYHEEVKSMVRANGLVKHVLFLGHRQDMPEIYNLCDVTVLTSSREGTPNVLLESMACGVPVVATDVSDNVHLVPGGDVGYIVGVGQVDEMGDRVCHLLADARKRQERGRVAREWIVREFSAHALARKTEAVYVDILKKKGQASKRQT